MASATCDEYCRIAWWFLQAEYGQGATDLARIAPSDVVAFVSDYAGRVSRGTARQVATALRGFLRWLQFRGLCDARLVAAVPGIPYWKLASIPKLLTDDQVRLLLAAFDRSTDVGRRDYAIALCLLRLGMRSCEVAQLRLEDIDWRGGTLRIDGGKRRRSHVLPLPSDVARAVVAYLKRGRPRSSERGVFLRHTLPHRPVCSADIQTVVRRAHERGRVGSPWKGTHVLRHTVASRLLRGGATLKQIADILGHRSIDTTAIYAKVDLERLAGVALPWPAVRP
jgi:integrase